MFIKDQSNQSITLDLIQIYWASTLQSTENDGSECRMSVDRLSSLAMSHVNFHLRLSLASHSSLNLLYGSGSAAKRKAKYNIYKLNQLNRFAQPQYHHRFMVVINEVGLR